MIKCDLYDKLTAMGERGEDDESCLGQSKVLVKSCWEMELLGKLKRKFRL
jgi:hypothetical protein